MTASQEFTAQQLAANRSTRWHQDGSGLLTIESLREWVSEFGLVLYVPRSLQIPAPAPSFAEAILGQANPGPGVAELEQTRGMLARLAAEGTVLPLNLLGTVGDVPDFLVSTQVFSYIFTLRGDKAWKQAPETSGTVKVSQLAANAYEALAGQDALSATQLATELGREVTEAAVVRALSELWGHLRVLPVPQADGGTLWELTTKRFTKQIKAGTNAGLPKALSALVSLYLLQAVAATEEEIATFLSPLAARSRIREVLHALMAGRQLETVVLEGKTLLHVGGELPVFEALPVAEEASGAVPAVAAEAVASPRISTYKAKAAVERERRPFKREGTPRTSARPSFDKPWEEEKAARPAASEGAAPGFRPKREYGERPPRKTFGDKPSFGERPKRTYGDKPSFGDRPKRTYGDKPSFGDRPARKSFGDKPSFGDRPPRKSFGDKPSFGDRPKRTYGDKPSFGERSPRKSFGDKPSFGERPKRTYGDKPAYRPRTEGDGERKPFRKFDAPRGDGPRKAFGDRPPRKSFGDKPSFGDRPKRTYGDKPAYRPRTEGDGERKPFRKFDAPRGDGPRKTFGEKPSFAKKPGGFGGKKFEGKAGKFAGAKKEYTGKPKGKFGSYTKPAYPGLPKGKGPGLRKEAGGPKSAGARPARPRRAKDDEGGA